MGLIEKNVGAATWTDAGLCAAPFSVWWVWV